MTTPGEQNAQAALIASVDVYVQEYMSHYDPSHDYKHIQRVLRLAHALLAEERATNTSSSSSVEYDDTLVTLGALLHDVGDKKYLGPGQDPTTLVRDVLVARDCPAALAATVQDLVLHVSFSTETRTAPQTMRDKIGALPELAIVQDADRLDALGAVGMGRCFAFTGAHDRAGTGLDGAVDHFVEKLERLEGMMKTAAGRRLARERTERIKTFRGWWESENLGLS